MLAGQILKRHTEMDPRETPEVNQASGNSIFWALVALALNAMTEPSRIGILFRRGPGTTTNFNPGFDPLRSSPVVCAAETILDIFFFIVQPKAQTTTSDTNPTPNAPNTTESRPLAGGQNPEALSDPALATTQHPQPNVENTTSSRSMLKVLAFLLGVIPQAIKLFSMRGIIGTQICAAIFLAASIARAISCKSSSQFTASIHNLNDTDTSAALLWILLMLFTYVAHWVVYIWVYFRIVVGHFNNAAAAAAASYQSGNILLDLATWAKFFYLSFALLTCLFNLVWRHSLPRTKLFPLALSIFLPDTNTLPSRTKSLKFAQAVNLFMSSVLCSLLVSALCISLGRGLSRLAAKRAAQSGGHSDGGLPTTSANAVEPGSMHRSHVTNTLRQGLAWLKAVFVELCRALDNHGEWLGTWHLGSNRSAEYFVLAYGIFNLLTVLLYYLVVFDSTGTSSPSWNSALG